MDTFGFSTMSYISYNPTDDSVSEMMDNGSSEAEQPSKSANIDSSVSSQATIQISQGSISEFVHIPSVLS